MARQVRTLAERRAALVRRSELALLTQLPNWEVFSAVIEDDIESIQRSLVARMMGDAGVTLVEQAFERGRISGLRQARQIPERERQRGDRQAEREVAVGE